MGSLGATELLIILGIVVLIFGVGKIADVGPALGKAISGFRDAVQDEDKETEEEEGEGEEEIPPEETEA